MSEPELRDLLREHLADEPPVRITDVGAVRTARRQTRVRYAVAGAAAVLVLGAGAAVGSGLVDRADAPTVSEGPSLQSSVDSVARARLAPYTGELGAPTWTVGDLMANPVDADDPRAQFFMATYAVDGGSEVRVSVYGFADADQGQFVRPVCEGETTAGRVDTCEDDVLEDGSVVTTSVQAHEREDPTGNEVVPLDEALADPTAVWWVRAVRLSTAEGVAVTAYEYVDAPSPGAAEWRVPVEALREVATDPRLGDPYLVAHETTAGGG